MDDRTSKGFAQLLNSSWPQASPDTWHCNKSAEIIKYVKVEKMKKDKAREEKTSCIKDLNAEQVYTFVS